MYTIEALVTRAQRDGASDLHLISGLPPKYRLDGQITNMGTDLLTDGAVRSMAMELAGDEWDTYCREGELDAAAAIAGCRCRIHIFSRQGVPSVALRLLRESIPALSSLGLPPAAMELVRMKKGIVLVTGETGSGKSTTLASMIDYINHTRQAHIVTLEDPVEYIYKADLCAINQREVGKDTRSFASGLRASLREDPDVILIGEMRDLETIETAITAAETGHLVFGTLHTGSAADSVDRMVQTFPEGEQNQIRLQLSMVLQAVITQQLLPKKTKGRALACELMIVNDAIRNQIRTGNTPQITNTVATSRELGGQTMDQSLIQLSRAGQISRETAVEYAKDTSMVKRAI